MVSAALRRSPRSSQNASSTADAAGPADANGDTIANIAAALADAEIDDDGSHAGVDDHAGSDARANPKPHFGSDQHRKPRMVVLQGNLCAGALAGAPLSGACGWMCVPS